MLLFASSIKMIIVWSPAPLLKVEEVNFHYLPQRGKSEKLKKGWMYGAGAGLLKGRAGVGGAADTFPILFFQSLSFLGLEITLSFAKLCNAFEEILFFLSP